MTNPSHRACALLVMSFAACADGATPIDSAPDATGGAPIGTTVCAGTPTKKMIDENMQDALARVAASAAQQPSGWWYSKSFVRSDFSNVKLPQAIAACASRNPGECGRIADTLATFEPGAGVTASQAAFKAQACEYSDGKMNADCAQAFDY